MKENASDDVCTEIAVCETADVSMERHANVSTSVSVDESLMADVSIVANVITVVGADCRVDVKVELNADIVLNEMVLVSAAVRTPACISAREIAFLSAGLTVCPKACLNLNEGVSVRPSVSAVTGTIMSAGMRGGESASVSAGVSAVLRASFNFRVSDGVSRRAHMIVSNNAGVSGNVAVSIIVSVVVGVLDGFKLTVSVLRFAIVNAIVSETRVVVNLYSSGRTHRPARSLSNQIIIDVSCQYVL